MGGLCLLFDCHPPPPRGGCGAVPGVWPTKICQCRVGRDGCEEGFSSHTPFPAGGGWEGFGRTVPSRRLCVGVSFYYSYSSSIDRAQSAADQSNYVVNFSTRTEDHACGCARVRGQS
ncbi:unnamed protein product [Ectocarpus fasciculatus]